MNRQKHIGLRPHLVDAAIRNGVFVARVMPHVTMTGMDFFVIKRDACTPVEHVSQAGCVAGPYPLDFFTPARLQNLVNVERYTNIKVAGDQSKRGVACQIKTPRCDADVMHDRAVFTRHVGQPVIRSGVGDQNEIGLFG